MTELWELAAREQIRHTVAAYTIAGDSGRVEELAEQFVADGVLEVYGEARAQGRPAIVAMLARNTAAGALPPTKDVPFFVRHFVANVFISSLTPTEARVVSYYAVLTPAGLDHWGRYRDVFVPDGERWLIQHRVSRVDSSVPDSWYRRTFAGTS